MSLSDRDIQRFLEQPAGSGPVDVVDRPRIPAEWEPRFLIGLVAFVFGFPLAIFGTVLWAAWRWTMRREW